MGWAAGLKSVTVVNIFSGKNGEKDGKEQMQNKWDITSQTLTLYFHHGLHQQNNTFQNCRISCMDIMDKIKQIKRHFG